LCRFVFHTHLAHDGQPAIQTAGALKVRSHPWTGVQSNGWPIAVDGSAGMA
jgi:hypothetical protein